jgi:hypothetical protein
VSSYSLGTFYFLEIVNYTKTSNTQQAQAVIRKVDEAMKAFFGFLRSKINKRE